MLHKSAVTVKDIMITTVRSVRASDSIFDATQLLCKNGFSGAPVLDEEGRLEGILSEKDCIHAFLNAIHHRSPPVTVQEVMTANVITVTEETEPCSPAGAQVSCGTTTPVCSNVNRVAALNTSSQDPSCPM